MRYIKLRGVSTFGSGNLSQYASQCPVWRMSCDQSWPRDFVLASWEGKSHPILGYGFRDCCHFHGPGFIIYSKKGYENPLFYDPNKQFRVPSPFLFVPFFFVTVWSSIAVRTRHVLFSKLTQEERIPLRRPKTQVKLDFFGSLFGECLDGTNEPLPSRKTITFLFSP